MKKKIIICLISIFLFLFLSSCPQEDMSENIKLNELRSKSISLPSWCDCAVSPWISWQSEQGQKLHEYVSDSVISDDFEGNYRIIYRGSDLGICFSDREGTLVDLFFLCEQKNTSTDSDERIEFDCTAKKTLYEDSTESNRAYLIVEKLSDNLLHFNLSVDGKELIDSDVKELDERNLLVKRPNWLKKMIVISDFRRHFWEMAHFYQYDQAYSLITIDKYPFFNLTSPNVSENFTFSYEGVSIRNQDDENHIFSIDLLDGDLGGNSDYVEIKMRDDKVRIDNGVIDEYDSVDITFYKIIDGTLSIVKKYENLICYD